MLSGYFNDNSALRTTLGYGEIYVNFRGRAGCFSITTRELRNTIVYGERGSVVLSTSRRTEATQLWQ